MGSVCRQRDVDQHPCWHDARPEQEGEPHPGVGWPRSDQISDEVRPVRPGYAEHDLRRRVRSSNWLRGSSNAGKPHSYSASLSGLGLWVPVRLDTSIGKNTKELDSTSATPRNSSIGRYR